MYDIIIVGAGPAGLASAIYAKRAGKKVLVIEKKTYGGQIITSSIVENYPGFISISGFDFATKLYDQVKALDTEFIYEEVINVVSKTNFLEVTTNKNTYQTKTLIVAVGTEYKKLGLEKEDELLGKGISYCATCDGAFYKDKCVAIVGGGNSAVEEALYLSNIAKKVYVINKNEAFKGDKISIDTLDKKENIEVLYNSNIVKLISSKTLEKVVVSNEGLEKEININGLFIAIGRVPSTEVFKNILSLDEFGYIKTDGNCHTNCKNIFAAGDACKKDLRQLVTATYDGVVSATSAIQYLEENENNFKKNA